MLNVSNARHTHSAPYHINVSHLLWFNMYIFHLCTKYPWHDKERGRGKRWEKKYDERLLAINPIFASMNIYFRLSPNKLCTVHSICQFADSVAASTIIRYCMAFAEWANQSTKQRKKKTKKIEEPRKAIKKPIYQVNWHRKLSCDYNIITHH